MRTGSVGNRSAEDMIKTLVEPKKSVISEVRSRLLLLGFSEEVEYDAVNIDPVLIYNRMAKVVLLKHKWDLLAMLRVGEMKLEKQALKDHEVTDDEGNKWLRFDLQTERERLFAELEEK